jgi:serine/threonine-protein kinase HipA
VAQLLWGKVYFHDDFAGILREEPNQTISFTYDADYLRQNKPKIAHSLPLQQDPHISFYGLPPFFDNLVSEGWLEQAQTKLLGKRIVSRFELLLAFGFDCAGAVSIIDPEPNPLSDDLLDINDPKEMATMTGRASLSGVQPKLAIIQKNGVYYPSSYREISTHIAKFPSNKHFDLIENEYLSMKAFKALVPDDIICNVRIDTIKGFHEPALIITRFDHDNGKKIHFEEFNQLLQKPSKAKYEGSYKEMADFIAKTQGCLPAQNYLLFRRILAGFLIGNTDMHFKNFALFHTASGYRLTPSYDQVSAALYDYKTIALETGGVSNILLSDLKIKHIVLLGQEFGLSKDMIKIASDGLGKNLAKAKEIIHDSNHGTIALKNQLVSYMDKRWNGIFSLIGKALSAKP